MNTRRFPAAVVAAATFTLLVRYTAPATAQESSTPNAAAAAAESVQLSGGVADILKLSKAKIGDEITVAFIQNGDRRYSLNASEIIYLREQGVSDRVLATMLNQQPQFANAPQPAAPAASAPQYAAPPATTTVVETAPASTPYVIPSTPTYYSFYDPSPYWYEPWPYWYTSPYWYGYPLFTFGWGNCGYGYWNHGYCYNGHWNNYWHDGNHHGAPHNGNHANGNSPPHDGRSIPGGKTAMQASKGSPAGGVNQAGPRSGPGPSARNAQSATQAGFSGNNRSQPAAPRTGTSQANVISARGGQGTGPTRVWTGNAGQGPTSRGVVTQSAPSVAGPSRVSASPTTVWNKSASQPSRPAANIAGSYQRNSYSPSYGYRAGGNVTSIGRPSMSSSYGSMGNTSAFRSGGGFGGTSAPSMHSGGGFRGGGGGGFGSGGFSHGGGGGGGHHR